jgi:hypothetical protein
MEQADNELISFFEHHGKPEDLSLLNNSINSLKSILDYEHFNQILSIIQSQQRTWCLAKKCQKQIEAIQRLTNYIGNNGNKTT